MSIFLRGFLYGVCALSFSSFAFANPTQTDISTCEQLQAMNHNLYGNYFLIDDIECAGFSFTPVGTTNAPFSGTLEGNGYSIRDIVMNDFSATHGGLFGVVQGAYIQNVVLENFSMTATDYLGTLAGEVRASTTIFNVHATGRVYGAYVYDIGGLIGFIEGASSAVRSIIQNASAGVEVDAPLSLSVGGLVGRVYYFVDIVDSSASGSVFGRYDVGGLVGTAVSSNNFSGVWASGHVDGESAAGGLIGEITNSNNWIVYSYATGDVVVRSYDGGGLIGVSTAPATQVHQSYATGDVTYLGTDAYSNIGGLIGRLYGTITDSYATGDVISHTGYAGGLIGYALTGGVINSYSSGWVGGGTIETGGLIGGGSPTLPVTSSYWDTTTSQQFTSAGGTGKTTEQMMQQSTYVGWNFNTVWAMDIGYSYPWLQW